MGGETVAEGVATGAFGHAGGEDGVADGALDDAVVHVVAALGVGAGVGPAVLLGEYPLPGPFAGGVGVFPLDSGGEEHASPAFGKVLVVDFTDLGEMFFKTVFQGGGEHGDAVFGSFTVVNDDFIAGQVDVLDPQAEAFLKSHSGAVQEFCYQQWGSVQFVLNRAYLFLGEDHREPDGFLGADHVAQIA